jgi:hypothetical protein
MAPCKKDLRKISASVRYTVSTKTQRVAEGTLSLGGDSSVLMQHEQKG